MNAFAIQRMNDGQYVAPRFGDMTPDPNKAYLFVSREAAQGYIDRHTLADNHRPAILPSSRPLL